MGLSVQNGQGSKDWLPSSDNSNYLLLTCWKPTLMGFWHSGQNTSSTPCLVAGCRPLVKMLPHSSIPNTTTPRHLGSGHGTVTKGIWHLLPTLCLHRGMPWRPTRFKGIFYTMRMELREYQSTLCPLYHIVRITGDCSDRNLYAPRFN